MPMTFLEIPGGRLEAELLDGREVGPAVILLHEGLGSLRLWRGLPRRVHEATGARVLAFSRFGHGKSDPPPRPRTPAFMHEEALDVLPAVLGAARIERPLLAGHSDGASIALIHAAAYPVSGLVLLAPHVFVEQICVDAIRQTRESFHRGGLRERMARHHRDPDLTFAGWCDVWLDPTFRNWNLEPLLPRIDAPTLVIQGRGDEYGSLAQLDAVERGVRGPVERLVVSGGHSPHLDHPHEVPARIVEFIERLRARAA
jgi:pimeloyl-ACP methyl ester carboxylesterase